MDGGSAESSVKQKGKKKLLSILVNFLLYEPRTEINSSSFLQSKALFEMKQVTNEAKNLT
jgi:hypothetical protein